jgi:hypothetical protein
MNATSVEVDDVMSVFCSESSKGVAGCDVETDESGTAAALADEACDLPFACSMFICGIGLADL